MNKFKSKIALLSFLTNFLFRFGGCLFLGIILLFIGINVPICHALGMGFIIFDFIASGIETIRLLIELKKSTNPLVKEVGDAVDSDTPYSDIFRVLAEYGIEDSGVQSDDISYLKKRLSINSTVEDCVITFRSMCTVPTVEGQRILYEIKWEDDLIVSLTRQCPDEENMYTSLCMEMVLEAEGVDKELSEYVWNTQLDRSIWDYIMDSESFEEIRYKTLKDLRMLQDEV